jgi:prophage tail gpP-like protein
MHIEAELDTVHAERLLELQQRLQKPLPEIVADILSTAIDARIEAPETEGQKMLNIFAEEGLIGCLQGDGNLSVDYKQHLWGNG